MQRAGQSALTPMFFWQTKLAGQGDHQRTHRHRVHVGIVVRGLELCQTDQYARVARYRLGNLIDQRQGLGSVYRPAHARFVEHRYHGLFGAGTNLRCPGQFFVHGHPRGDRCCGCALQLALHRGITFRLGYRLFRMFEHVRAAVGVDPHLMGAAFDNAADVGRIVEQKGTALKRVFHP